ncbi:MAG: sigma 54-interacting transcriptional regulator, partial [Desulfosarcina sp.]
AKEELTGLNLSELRDQEIIAESSAMLKVLQVAAKLAKIDASHILITGESGTGKGFLAKFIHNKSVHASQPFIQINCAAVPENLLEAELFGYEKGAFTGAGDKGKAGLIELAQDGTLFLDEIGDMPIRLQAKLLKYLDDHEVMRLGSVKARKIDCAIVSATNQNLETLVEEKRFRQDLFFRLNNFRINIPPLRERAEDIFELVHFFIRKYNKHYKRRKQISAKSIETLQAYAFSGNVRELKSLCKQAVLMSDERLLDGYFADNLQIVCSPSGPAQPDRPVRGNHTDAPVAATADPVALIAAWLVKILNPQPPSGAAQPESQPGAAAPLLTQVVRQIVTLGKMVYTESQRQHADRYAADPPPPSTPAASPPPSDQVDSVEEVVNLAAALDAREREIFLHATQHCRTIRELAEYLQTSPATALRKLKKHGIRL